MSDILQMVDEALRNRGTPPKPNWKQVIKFRLSKDETEALATWRRDRAVIEGKLAKLTPMALALMRKQTGADLAAGAADPKSDPMKDLTGLDRRGLMESGKAARAKLKGALATLTAQLDRRLADAGSRLHSECQTLIDKLASEHEADCRRFGLPPMPSSLVTTLRQSLGPLEAELARGLTPLAVVESFIGTIAP